MAVLGVQIVVTMVMASVLSKFSGYFSIAQWLICDRLVRYLHPTDEELRTLGGIPKTTNSGKSKGKRNRDKIADVSSQFMIPRNLEVGLESAVVKRPDMLQLRYYPEYQWLVDFSACSVVVYFLTEVYYYFFQEKDEVNLSMLWCLLVIGFSLKILLSLTILYFRGEESIGERSMCLTSGLFFFLIAMIVLITDENMLEFGLENAYKSFNSSAHQFLQEQGVDSSGPASKLMFKLSLAVWSGLLGAFFTFPGLRFARMHYDCLKYSQESAFFKLLLHISFIAPLLSVLMWVKPVARDYLTKITWIYGKDGGVIMGSDTFETVRLFIVVLAVCLRLALMPSYLQSYLNLAPGRLSELRKEAGRISNIDLQKRVARVFYYLCVVALQYVTPLFMCLYTVFLLKTLGGYSWLPISGESNTTVYESPAKLEFQSGDDSDYESILSQKEHFSLTINNLKHVFTPVLFRGVLGFMTWWLCTVWFSTSAIGLAYYSYFK